MKKTYIFKIAVSLIAAQFLFSACKPTSVKSTAGRNSGSVKNAMLSSSVMSSSSLDGGNVSSKLVECLQNSNECQSLVLAISNMASVGCSTPGEISVSSTIPHILQYCDGLKWNVMTESATNSCSTTPNSIISVPPDLYFCDGSLQRKIIKGINIGTCSVEGLGSWNGVTPTICLSGVLYESSNSSPKALINQAFQLAFKRDATSGEIFSWLIKLAQSLRSMSLSSVVTEVKAGGCGVGYSYSEVNFNCVVGGAVGVSKISNINPEAFFNKEINLYSSGNEGGFNEFKKLLEHLTGERPVTLKGSWTYSDGKPIYPQGDYTITSRKIRDTFTKSDRSLNGYEGNRVATQWILEWAHANGIKAEAVLIDMNEDAITCDWGTLQQWNNDTHPVYNVVLTIPGIDDKNVVVGFAHLDSTNGEVPQNYNPPTSCGGAPTDQNNKTLYTDIVQTNAELAAPGACDSGGGVVDMMLIAKALNVSIKSGTKLKNTIKIILHNAEEDNDDLRFMKAQARGANAMMRYFVEKNYNVIAAVGVEGGLNYKRFNDANVIDPNEPTSIWTADYNNNYEFLSKGNYNGSDLNADKLANIFKEQISTAKRVLNKSNEPAKTTRQAVPHGWGDMNSYMNIGKIPTIYIMDAPLSTLMNWGSKGYFPYHGKNDFLGYKPKLEYNNNYHPDDYMDYNLMASYSKAIAVTLYQVAMNGEMKQAPVTSDRLMPNESLQSGQKIVSSDKRFSLVYQNDGNLVLYFGINVLWDSHTNETTTGTVAMQGDGNFVIYSNGSSVFNTGTSGNPGSYIMLQNDGNLIIYTIKENLDKDIITSEPVWSSGTSGN